MSANIAELSASVAEMINDAALPELGGTQAKVYWHAPHTIEELHELQVDVVPNGVHQIEPLSRGEDIETFGPLILVQKRCNPNDLAELASLAGIAPAILHALNRRHHAIGDDHVAQWQSGVIEPIYGPSQLREANTFSSLLQLSYRVTRR